MPSLLRSPGIASSSVTAIWPRSGNRCWCWKICRQRRAWRPGQCHAHLAGAAVTPGGRLDQRAVPVDQVDGEPVDLDDPVAGLDAGRLGWSLVVDACDQRAARGRDVEALADVVGDLLNPHAEPAAARLAVLAQLIDNGDGAVRGNGKADSNRTPRRRDDRGIDADDLAVEVEQRSAGIAAIDRRISLNVVVVGTGIDVAVARLDDARGHRAAEAERIADGDHPFA